MTLESAVVRKNWALFGRTRASLEFAATQSLSDGERNRRFFSNHHDNSRALDALRLVALCVVLAGNLVLDARLHGLASEEIVFCFLHIIIELFTGLLVCLERGIMR